MGYEALMLFLTLKGGPMKRMLLITCIAVGSFAQAFAATTPHTDNAPAQVHQTEEDESDSAPQLMLASQCTMTPDQSKQPAQETTPAQPADAMQPAKMLLAGSCPSSDQCQQNPAPKNSEKAEDQKAVQPQLVA